MSYKPTDIELLNELKLRLESSRTMIEEQNSLMEQLQSVNKKLLESEQLKSNFLSNIRNEINNPVASILGLAKNISDGNLGVEGMKKFASLIYNEVFSLDFQLRNIFVSAEIEAGEAKLVVSSVNVSSVITNVVGSFSHQISKKKLRLIADNQLNGDHVFYTDPEKLHLIISNLLSNAIQYSHDEGIIQIESKLIDGILVLNISDNGIGIEEKDKEIIYDRFSQLESGATKSFAGHGLGLCITKALLEIINGEVSLMSNLNKGSTFTVKINQSDYGNEDKTIFSSDGNDFLFDDKGEIAF